MVLTGKNIVISHYHMIPGGVYQVINSQIDAFKTQGYKPLLCVSKNELNRIDDSVQTLYHERLGYNQNKKEIRETGNKLFTFFLKLWKIYKPIFIFHNYHLGKNPGLTQAVCRLAIETDYPVILYIHDFPECTRYKNYKLLKEWVTYPLYPVKDNIYYVCINPSDRDLLKSLNGGAKVSFLPNPLSAAFARNIGSYGEEKERNGREYLNKKLKALAEKRGKSIDPELPYIVYPVRTIRRKNIFEALLMHKVFFNEYNFFLTLPANSLPEKDYSRNVEAYFDENTVKGLWCVSKDEPEIYSFLMHFASFILSTSVLEGFGLFFIEAKSLGKNIFGRSLPVMGMFPELNSLQVYDSFFVPYPKSRIAGYKEHYKKRIMDFMCSCGDNYSGRNNGELIKNLDNYIKDDVIDFSFLNFSDQKSYLSELEEGKISDIRRFNPDIKRKTDQLKKTVFFDDIDLDIFSSDNYGKGLKKIIDAMEYSLQKTKFQNNREIQIIPEQKIREYFLAPQYLRDLFF